MGTTAALGGVVATTGIQLDDTFTISGTESMRGLEVLTDRLPQAAGTSEQVLITSSNGRIENHAPAVNAFALRASQIDGVATVSPPFGDKAAGVASSVSADGTHVLVQVQTDASVGSITTGTTPKAKTVAQDLDTLAERAEAMDPSLTVQRSGNIDQEVGIGISAVELVGVLFSCVVPIVQPNHAFQLTHREFAASESVFHLYLSKTGELACIPKYSYRVKIGLQTE